MNNWLKQALESGKFVESVGCELIDFGHVKTGVILWRKHPNSKRQHQEKFNEIDQATIDECRATMAAYNNALRALMDENAKYPYGQWNGSQD